MVIGAKYRKSLPTAQPDIGFFRQGRSHVYSWRELDSESRKMSLRSLQYQLQNGGRVGQVVRVGGVDFDSIAGRTLIESKGPGIWGAINNHHYGERTVERILLQARRQREATSGRIEWRVAEGAAANFIRDLFRSNNISITVRHVSASGGSTGSATGTSGTGGGFWSRLSTAWDRLTGG